MGDLLALRMRSSTWRVMPGRMPVSMGGVTTTAVDDAEEAGGGQLGDFAVGAQQDGLVAALRWSAWALAKMLAR